MKLRNIQMLRAVAALAVVFYHTGVETSEFCKSSGFDCKFEDWLGALGVSLFFIISGFIMVSTSWNYFGTAGAPQEFMKRRIFRIAPLYWILTTVTLCGMLVAPWIFKAPLLRLDYLVGSYLFWPVLRDDGLIRPVMKLGWTLNYEMFFYVVFAGALFFRRWLGLAISIFVLSGLLLLRSAGGFTGTSAVLQFWSDPIVLNFVIGIIAGIFYMQGVRTKIGVNLCLGLAALFGFFAIEFYSVALHSLPEDSFTVRSVIAAPVAVLFVAAAFGKQLVQSPVWVRIGLLLGDASYSMYLVHPFALRGTRALWSKLFGAEVSVWVFYGASIMLAVFSGLLCYFFIEGPVAHYLAGVGQRKDRRFLKNIAQVPTP